ncbi:MAG TPA: hypothetical protein VI821_00465 [Candidatus Paceibacterota bacterium]
MSQLSDKTKSIFSLISSHYIDIFYNILYTQAKKLQKDGICKTETEGYQIAIGSYLDFCNGNIKSTRSFYVSSLEGIKKFHEEYMVTQPLTTLQFIRILIEEFIPREYALKLQDNESNAILEQILRDSVSIFAEKIIRVYIYEIIDKHSGIDNESNVKTLQSEYFNILSTIRTKYYHEFARKSIRDTKVPYSQLREILTDFEKLGNENKKLREIISQYKILLDHKNEIITKFEKDFSELKEKYTQIESEKNTFSEKYAKQFQKIEQMLQTIGEKSTKTQVTKTAEIQPVAVITPVISTVAPATLVTPVISTIAPATLVAKTVESPNVTGNLAENTTEISTQFDENKSEVEVEENENKSENEDEENEIFNMSQVSMAEDDTYYFAGMDNFTAQKIDESFN